LSARARWIFVVALSAACEFGEVVIPDGEPIVVVHAVMRPDINRQWVLVEQTLTGSRSDSTGGSIPGNAPQVPISDAVVTVRNVNLPSDVCGAAQFTESPEDPDLPQSLGLYWGPLDCPTMRTGDTMALRVETIDGHVVSGVTQLPGARSMVLRVHSDSVILPGPTVVFNRDRDTLDAEILPIAGRALQVEIHRRDTLGVRLPVTRLFVDSTRLTVPGNLTDFFAVVLGEEDSTDAEDAEAVFRAGRYYDVTLALMDDHYFDFSRSGNLPISGRGFVNDLDGGMGLFGAIVAESNRLRVIGDVDDGREGVYNMRGTLEGRQIDIDVQLYVVATERDSTAASAFVRGQWVFGEIDTSADGSFVGDTLSFVVYQVDGADPGTISALLINGVVGMADAFVVDVYDRDLTVIGQLSATRTTAAQQR
jgi:hypothetical protein